LCRHGDIAENPGCLLLALENGFSKSGLRGLDMGRDITPDPPVLDPLLFYEVWYYEYIGACDDSWDFWNFCFKTGADIMAWFAGDHQCKDAEGLCNPIFGRSQYVYDIKLAGNTMWWDQDLDAHEIGEVMAMFPDNSMKYEIVKASNRQAWGFFANKSNRCQIHIKYNAPELENQM